MKKTYCRDGSESFFVSRPTNYSRVETFTATAYDASPEDNGPLAGVTSTGMPIGLLRIAFLIILVLL